MVERALACVAEGWVAEIVGEADGLDEIGIDVKGFREGCAGLLEYPAADGFSYLCDLEGVGEAGAVEVVFAGPEDLGFVLEAAEGGGVEDAVAIDLKGGAVVACIRGAGEAFGIEAAVEFVPHVV